MIAAAIPFPVSPALVAGRPASLAAATRAALVESSFLAHLGASWQPEPHSAPRIAPEPATPWRDLTDSGDRVTIAKGGAIWRTLRELERVLPLVRGYEARRLRLRMKRAGWRPL
ncbi:hypothetical protein D3C80_310490 [compost metagenome]